MSMIARVPRQLLKDIDKNWDKNRVDIEAVPDPMK